MRTSAPTTFEPTQAQRGARPAWLGTFGCSRPTSSTTGRVCARLCASTPIAGAGNEALTSGRTEDHRGDQDPHAIAVVEPDECVSRRSHLGLSEGSILDPAPCRGDVVCGTNAGTRGGPPSLLNLLHLRFGVA
jgi:hypothetical protein